MKPLRRVHMARLSMVKLSRESPSPICTPPISWKKGNLFLQGMRNRRWDGITPLLMENLLGPRTGNTNENTRNYGTDYGNGKSKYTRLRENPFFLAPLQFCVHIIFSFFLLRKPSPPQIIPTHAPLPLPHNHVPGKIHLWKSSLPPKNEGCP